jgi:hypothetical protein
MVLPIILQEPCQEGVVFRKNRKKPGFVEKSNDFFYYGALQAAAGPVFYSLEPVIRSF